MPQRTPKFARVRAEVITLLAVTVLIGQSAFASDQGAGQAPLGESLKQVQELDRAQKSIYRAKSRASSPLASSSNEASGQSAEPSGHADLAGSDKRRPDSEDSGERQNSDESKKRREKARGDAPCLCWTMPLAPPRAVIVCVHGLGLHSGSFEQFGKAMMKRGYAVYAIDVRGFGSWMAAKGHQNVNFDACLEDVKTTIEAVRRANPGKTIVLLGESMGGAIALQSTALHPELVDILISAVPAGERFQQKKTDLKVALHMLTGPRRKFDAGSDVVNQATSDPSLREEWKNDPLGRMELSPKELVQFQKFMNQNHDRAKDIKKTPVLIVQGAKDKLVKPEGTVELYEELATADKELAMVDWAEHLIFEEGQFNDQILNVVDNWIAARLPGGKAVAYLNKAKQLLQARQLAEAIEVLKQAVQADPQSGEAELILGLAYAKTQQNELAREHLRKAMRLDRSTMNPEHRRKANQALMALPPGIIAPRLVAALRGGPGLPRGPMMRKLQQMGTRGGGMNGGMGQFSRVGQAGVPNGTANGFMDQTNGATSANGAQIAMDPGAAGQGAGAGTDQGGSADAGPGASAGRRGPGRGFPMPPRMRRKMQMMQMQGGQFPMGAGRQAIGSPGGMGQAGTARGTLADAAGGAQGNPGGEAQSDAGSPRVLVFGAQWCEPCKDLEPVIAEAKKRFGNQVEFVNINVDDPKNEELVERYNVSPIPTIVFLTSDGQVADYAIGYAGVPGMIKGMAKILAKR